MKKPENNHAQIIKLHDPRCLLSQKSQKKKYKQNEYFCSLLTEIEWCAKDCAN